MRSIIVLFGFSFLVTPVFAHHSVAFYGDEDVQLTGILVDVDFVNPHIRFRLEAQTEAGLSEIWTMESGSVQPLRRAGVTPDLFPIGQEVTVVGKQSTRQERAMLATNMFLPDGKELLLWLNAFTLIDDDPLLVDAIADDKGIFRVWSVPVRNLVAAIAQIDTQPFTEAAVAGRASWNETDNFVTRCEPEGMPRIMVNPHAFEFVDRGAEFSLRTELYDIERTIHMDRETPPGDEPWSRLGYSVGSWDGNDLVVRTTRINWPYFDTIGTPQSEDVAVVERFVLSNDQSRLDFEVTVTDPQTFTRPAVLRGYWLALGATIPRYDCVPVGQ